MVGLKERQSICRLEYNKHVCIVHLMREGCTLRSDLGTYAGRDSVTHPETYLIYILRLKIVYLFIVM